MDRSYNDKVDGRPVDELTTLKGGGLVHIIDVVAVNVVLYQEI